MATEDDNLRPCHICGQLAAFEGIDEGEVCGECSAWVCDNCVDWKYMREIDTETPICVVCAKEAKK
jgi:hypothetical protein